MGILDRLHRVDLGGGDWIDVKPLSAEDARALDVKARAVKAKGGESESAAATYFYLAIARERIMAWSDAAPVTPENTAKVSAAINHRLWDALTEVQSDLPLPTGSDSTATSEASQEA